MITMFTVVCAIIYGVRTHRSWLVVLAALDFLFAACISFVRFPQVLAFVLLVIFLAYALYVVLCVRPGGRIVKTPLVLLLVAALIRIAWFACARYANAHVIEWSFHNEAKIQCFMNGIYALMGLTAAACCAVVLYYVISCKKLDKKARDNE